MILNSPTISGSLTVTGNIITSGSITLSGSVASASFAATSSFVALAQSASYVLTAQTASFVANAQTASFVALAQSASYVLTAQTASFVALAQSASNAVSAQTASFANAFTVAGTLTAQTLVVQTITSSVDFVTGSTRFGSILDNTHVFSGSVTMNPGGLFVSSSGNVGIGTTSPTRQLFVNSTAFFDNIGSGSTSNPSIAIGSTSLGISYLGGSNMALITNGDTRMYISASGAIGIGATSPVGKLNLAGSTTQYIVLTNTAADGVTDAIQGGIIGQSRGYANNLAQMASILFRNKATSPWYKGEITFSTNDTDGTDPSVAVVERMRITSGGNVGIGTSSPNQQLTLKIVSTNNSLIAFQNAAGTATTYFGIGNATGDVISTSTTADTCLRNETGNILFATNGNTERMRITVGGIIQINGGSYYSGAGSVNTLVSSASDFCYSGANTNASNPRGVFITFPNSTAGDFAYYLASSAATKFYVNGNGVIYSTNTSVQAISDARHKENIRDLDKGLSEILLLKPRLFDWKEGKGTGNKNVMGFIAQEVEGIFPELISDWKETIDATESFKTIAISNIIPYLTKAIQELKTQNDALQSRIETLESK
jgi:hypothetical protein